MCFILKYKDNGYLPEAIINYLVRLGWSHGDQEIFSANEIKTIKLSIYRFDPLKDKKPFMQDFDIDVPADKDLMVLDVLMTAKEQPLN